MSNSAQAMSATLLESLEQTAAAFALVTDSSVIKYNNPAFQRRYGDCTAKNIEHFFNPEQLEQLSWLMRAAGSEVDKIVLPLRDNLGAHSGKKVMVQIWPISEGCCLMSISEDYSVHRIADLDELTHLPNRRKALMLLDIEKARTNRASSFCLALGDIDRFKSVNDTYGHDIGDQVLQHVSQVMTATLREGDWVARWGGEEFLVFTSDSDLITGMQPIERIRSALERTPFEGPPALNITMSFGFVSSLQLKNAGDMINKADMLLYEAKRNGRNRIEWESGGEVIWTAGNIRKVIASDELHGAFLPLRGWQDGEPHAHQIIPYLRGYNYTSTDKIIFSAGRLRQQVLIDKKLLEVIGREWQQGHGRLLFPMHSELCRQQADALKNLFAADPNICIGIDAADPLPDSILRALIHDDRPIALLNYNVRQAPSYLLGLPNLKYIVFTGASDAGELLPRLTDDIRCYITCPPSMTKADKAARQKDGFSGYLERPADDAILS